MLTNTIQREVSVDELVEGPLGGWHLLALANYERPLTPAEVKVVERLPAADAVDLLFPGLPDAAKQEALWALG
jgi:hypothetical protein